MYEIKFTSHKQYLFARLVSIKAKETRTGQSTPFLLFSYSVRDETNRKPSIVAKKIISNVYGIDANCFAECFLFHVITGRRYFFQKSVVILRFFQSPYCCFL